MIYTKSRQDLETFYKRTESKSLIICGAGEIAMRFINKFLKNRPIAYFCDNDPEKQGTKLYGSDIVSPRLLAEVNPDDVVILIASVHSEAIRRQLNEINSDFDIFNARILLNDIFIDIASYFYDYPQKIEEVLGMLHDDKSKWIYQELVRRSQLGDLDFSDLMIPGAKEYILPEAFANVRPDNEIIIDGGAYDGTAIKTFINLFGPSLSKIYSFEPGRSQFPILKELIRRIYLRNEHPEITLLPYGLSDRDEETEYCFVPGEAVSSFVVGSRKSAPKAFPESEKYTIKTVRLDDIIPKNERVTLIKMDIEGSEYNALLGAAGIIKTHKPRLAISIYHQGVDYTRIPKLVKELVPEYKLSIRHHCKNQNETDLYAYL